MAPACRPTSVLSPQCRQPTRDKVTIQFVCRIWTCLRVSSVAHHTQTHTMGYRCRHRNALRALALSVRADTSSRPRLCRCSALSPHYCRIRVCSERCDSRSMAKSLRWCLPSHGTANNLSNGYLGNNLPTETNKHMISSLLKCPRFSDALHWLTCCLTVIELADFVDESPDEEGEDTDKTQKTRNDAVA